MNMFEEQIVAACGVSSEEAFIIDEVNLYERLGEPLIRKLSTNFYQRVFNDEQKWFRNIFKGKKIEDAIDNQVDFFCQRFGGPPLYSERKGHPALIARHIDFVMTEQAAVRWLEHMQAALDETTEIDGDSKERMMKFFKHTAYFLSFGVTANRQRS